MSADDRRWLAAALALSERGRGRTAPNPNVGCVIVRDGRVVGRGWTQPSGRPHAEAVALAEAGARAEGATAYVTLEPCAHESTRGPACADMLVTARPARVVIAVRDPDPRTNGRGAERLRAAGVAVVEDADPAGARAAMPGFFARAERGRPFVTLKLAMSLDGAMARADGESRWITGPEARAHAHVERSRHEAILVGRGTWEADRPALGVRLAGMEQRGPRLVLLSTRPAVLSEVAAQEDRPDASFDFAQDERSWTLIKAPHEVGDVPCHHLLVEGGPATAAAFLRADLVDRLLLYRAPILIGGGRTLPEIGLSSLADAHGRWRLTDARQLGRDRLEVYARA